MWDERARGTRREVAALAAAGLGVRDLFTQSIELVEQVVPVELTCWAVLDPGTAVISTMVNGPVAIPAEFEPRLAAAEYSAGEPHTFQELARRRAAVTSLADLDTAARSRSRRLQTVWRPLGLDNEVRVVFLAADGTAWGAAGMVRRGAGFSARELDYLATVAPAIAAATRLAVRADVAARGATPGSAVVVVGADGAIRSSTAPGLEWRRRFDDLAPGRFAAVLRLMVAGMTSSRAGFFEALLQDGVGDWAVLRATPLLGEDVGGAAVTINAAGAADLLSATLRAFGLTSREREVCEQVLHGSPTAAIAETLFISPYTVQDHLKAVFEKVGVHSRRELVGKLLAEE